jgi:hypothetical protein
MWALLTSRLAGPIATGAAALLAIALAVVWISDARTISSLRTEKAALDERINDPDTGYVVTLERARANAGQYKRASDSCNTQVQALEAETARKAAAAQAEIDKGRRDLVAANRRAAQLLVSTRLPGEDECTAARRAAQEINR